MNKYKITLKGNDEGFSVDTKGELNYIIASMMQFICEVSIANDITKKDFLNSCKESYEVVMKGEINNE